jgi:hypothetical protein
MQPLKLPSLLHGTPYFKTFNTIESPLWSFPFLLFPIQENVFFKFHLTEYILEIRGLIISGAAGAKKTLYTRARSVVYY